ncbi:MAG: ribose-phosphate pyrophosphokinase [Candidatus Diapherotrites archaeon]|nr:ribose-phosphate pyrophosphokinase [Candidatus Diapherotrites archaeon]
MANPHLKLFAGNSNTELAKKVAGHLGVQLGKIEIRDFSDGEKYVKLLENVRGEDVFLLQSTSKPVNENLMELLIMIDAAKRASAGNVTAVIPYFGYARQDRKASSREPITAKLVADIITAAGADRMIAFDLHSGQIQGFFNIPVDNLTAYGLLINEIKKKKLSESDSVVVAADAGAAKNSVKIAKALGWDLAIINKARPAQNVASALNIIGEVKGRNCALFDDMIDTAGTVAAGAEALKKAGAKDIYVLATHGVLSGPAIERVEKSPVKEIIITNTIQASPAKSGKIKVIDISGLLAEAIERVHKKESVSSLFDYRL